MQNELIQTRATLLYLHTIPPSSPVGANTVSSIPLLIRTFFSIQKQIIEPTKQNDLRREGRILPDFSKY